MASASDIANWQEQLGQVETQLGQTATADLATKAGQDKVALDRAKQLVAAGVRDGDRLELVDTGGGV